MTKKRALDRTMELVYLEMGRGTTVYMVDWRAPTQKDPAGDIIVEEFRTLDDSLPKNWTRGSHYRDYFYDGELAYRYAEHIQAELGIKALFGSWESHQQYKAQVLRRSLEVEEIEVRRRNSMYGRLLSS